VSYDFQKQGISLNSINQFIFVMEPRCVFFEEGIGFDFKKVNDVSTFIISNGRTNW
jgi:hypothetical protein